MEAFDEELHVLCHACGLGRSDVASKAIATIKSNLLAEGQMGFLSYLTFCFLLPFTIIRIINT